MFYTKGGIYSLAWKKLNRKMFHSKKEVVDALKAHMVEQGCKEKNLQVIMSGDIYEGSVLEVRNRHMIDEDSSTIPMTGYVIEMI